MLLSGSNSGLLSPSMAKVLRVLQLAPPGSSGRRIAALSGGFSVGQVNQVLLRLESIGVVRAVSVPPAKKYFLNLEHALTEHLLAIAIPEYLVEGWLKAKLAKPSRGVLSATIFGSVARAEARVDSDIDLYLITKRGVASGLAPDWVLSLSEEFENRFGTSLGIIHITEAELTPKLLRQSALIDNVIKEGRLIYGRSIMEIVGSSGSKNAARPKSSSKLPKDGAASQGSR